ncbi:MAG: hypothetical protein R3E95_08735 [Thiolinea sp.]
MWAGGQYQPVSWLLTSSLGVIGGVLASE